MPPDAATLHIDSGKRICLTDRNADMADTDYYLQDASRLSRAKARLADVE